MKDEFQPLDPTQELIFPPELLVRQHGYFMCLFKSPVMNPIFINLPYPLGDMSSGRSVGWDPETYFLP